MTTNVLHIYSAEALFPLDGGPSDAVRVRFNTSNEFIGDGLEGLGDDIARAIERKEHFIVPEDMDEWQALEALIFHEYEDRRSPDAR